MKILKTLSLFTLVFTYTTCYSQNIKMNNEIEEIIALGKDSIVQLALNVIDERVKKERITVFYTNSNAEKDSVFVTNSIKYLPKEKFTKVKILTNGEEILVYFSNPIEYVPKKDVFYFGAKVNLLSKKIYYNTLRFWKAFDVIDYNQREEAKEKVLFVLKALNDSRYFGSIDIFSFEDNMHIAEYEFYYDINIMSDIMEADYRISSKDGSIFEKSHSSIEPNPFADSSSSEDINQFKEIDWDKN